MNNANNIISRFWKILDKGSVCILTCQRINHAGFVGWYVEIVDKVLPTSSGKGRTQSEAMAKAMKEYERQTR